MINKSVLRNGIVSAVFATSLFLGIGTCFSEIREEKEERPLQVEKLKRTIPTHKLSYSAALFFGYDSNPDLTSAKKGDMFEEFLYSLSFKKPWMYQTQFRFDYDLDVLEYNDSGDLSNILNHIRFEADKKLFWFDMGTGYDLAIFTYMDNKDGNFLFHRPFIYLSNELSKNLYHQMLFEYGFKGYISKNALDDTVSTYQEKERLDKRGTLEYGIFYLFSPELLFKFRTKYSVNDSNAKYLGFYDYKLYQFSPGIDYKLVAGLELFTDVSYIRKNYDVRTVTLRDYRQKDRTWVTNVGMRYKLNKNNIVSLSHAYRENTSNDSLEEYTDGIVTCGWQYNF